jgi:hypothetical protein
MQHGMMSDREIAARATMSAPPEAGARVATAPRSPRTAKLEFGTIGAALIGFVIGAVVWHFVGFWGFVREVVVKGPPVTHAAVAQSGPNCTELVLDRGDRSVRLLPCATEAVELAEAGVAVKGDFLVASRDTPKRWTVTVQEEPDDRAVASASVWLLQPSHDDSDTAAEPVR